jgi:hypothetical protein
MRFALQSLIFLVATLSACGVAGQIITTTQTKETELCQRYETRAERSYQARPFTTLLAKECRAAMAQMEAESSVLASWYARSFLDRVSDLNEAISTLDRQPTQSGEFLIAREVEILDALQNWMRVKNAKNPLSSQSE